MKRRSFYLVEVEIDTPIAAFSTSVIARSIPRAVRECKSRLGRAVRAAYGPGFDCASDVSNYAPNIKVSRV